MSLFRSEDQKMVEVLAPAANRFSGNPDTAPINCKGHSSVLFLIHKGAGATGTATIVAKAATNAAKANPQAIPFRYKTLQGDVEGAHTAGSTSGITTAAGANNSYAVEVDVRDLPDGKPYLFLTLTEVVADATVVAGVSAILSGSRYGQGASVLA